MSQTSDGLAKQRGEEGGSLRIYGLTGRQHQTLHPSELEELVAQGHALRVQDSPRLAADREDWAAGWLGSRFGNTALRIQAPAVRIPRSSQPVADHGVFWIDSRQRIYGMLEAWPLEAAKDCFEKGPVKGDLAALMLWVLPDRIEAQAALWYARPSEQEKKRELGWQVHLRESSGISASPKELEAEFIRVAQEHPALASRRLPVATSR